MDRTLIEENDAERVRLAAVVGRLTEADLACPLGGGWTVATALAHLAFWDRCNTLVLEHWERHQAPPAGMPEVRYEPT